MVIHFPLISEKAVDLIEKQNKLVFIVDKDATKEEIKKAVEELYKVKVIKVNTSTNIKGRKRAFVKLSKENPATEIATKLNII